MSIERSVFLLASVMIIISTLLAMFVHTNWLWFSLFIGFNMFQSIFTGFCPPKWLFKKMGMKSEAELNQLEATR